MEINIMTLTTAVTASLITLLVTKLWDLWRETEKAEARIERLLNKSLFTLLAFWQTLQTWDFEKQVTKSEKMINLQLAEIAARTNSEFGGITFSEKDKNEIIAFQRQKAAEKLASLLDQMNRSIEELSVIRPPIAAEILDMQLRSPYEQLVDYVEAKRGKGNSVDPFSEHMTTSMLNQQFQLFKNVLSQRLAPFIRLIAGDINKKTLKETNSFLEDFGANWADAFGDDPDADEQAKEAGISMMLKAAQTSPTIDPGND